MTTEKNIESTPIEKCVNFTNFMLLLQKVCDYCALRPLNPMPKENSGIQS